MPGYSVRPRRRAAGVEAYVDEVRREFPALECSETWTVGEYQGDPVLTKNVEDGSQNQDGWRNSRA